MADPIQKNPLKSTTEKEEVKQQQQEEEQQLLYYNIGVICQLMMLGRFTHETPEEWKSAEMGHKEDDRRKIALV